MKEFEITLNAVSRKNFRVSADSKVVALLLAEAILENIDLLDFSNQNVDSMNMSCEEQCGGVCEICSRACEQCGNCMGESMGMSTKSSGICVMNFCFGCFLENFIKTESISSPYHFYFVLYYFKVCLKNHFRNLQAPLCGIFCPHSVRSTAESIY